ncbi:AbrB family transcriptional regulator [Clostridia bacterium]|nr:AbrB family transcriptional regulator [Clostridia bacterium]
MKATGIVRRIDDLGRVVIPKEIRRTMRIREGDPLEIFTDHEGEVIFKKYSPIEEMGEAATFYAESVNKALGVIMIVADRDTIVSCAGIPKKDILDRKLSAEFDALVESRQPYAWHKGENKLTVADRVERFFVKVSAPIFSAGDIIGAAAIIESDDMTEPTEAEINHMQIAAAFLGKTLDG